LYQILRSSQAGIFHGRAQKRSATRLSLDMSGSLNEISPKDSRIPLAVIISQEVGAGIISIKKPEFWRHGSTTNLTIQIQVGKVAAIFPGAGIGRHPQPLNRAGQQNPAVDLQASCNSPDWALSSTSPFSTSRCRKDPGPTFLLSRIFYRRSLRDWLPPLPSFHEVSRALLIPTTLSFLGQRVTTE
jgi:hypothetical protein